MTKQTVTRVFIGSVAAVVAGIVLAIGAVLGAMASNTLVFTGPDVTGIEWTPFAWVMIGLLTIAGLAILGGMAGGLVAWIGALLNTGRLEDKTWFIILLVLGLFSFGLMAMIAYLVAGPDAYELPRPGQPTPA
jgi:hypothetical protein